MNHQPPPLITVPVDLSDEAAAKLLDFLYEFAHHLESHYSEQLYRYHNGIDERQADPPTRRSESSPVPMNATPEELAQVRARCPGLPILLPGIGAQGGDLEASVAAGVDASGRGLLVSASRSVIYAGDGEAIRAEALGLARAINRIRASTGDG